MTLLSKPHGRRRFLGGVGAGGLVAAATIFGRTQSAAAATPNLVHAACCELLHPPSHNIYSCETGKDGTNWWAWNCGYTSGGYTYSCICCENYAHNYSTLYCVT